MTLLDSVRSQLVSITRRVRDEAERQALGMRETVTKIVLPIIPDVMEVLEETGAAGAVKKAAVLAYLSELYDTQIVTIDLPGPFDRVLHAIAKRLMLMAANRLIDVFATFLKSAAAGNVVATFIQHRAA